MPAGRMAKRMMRETRFMVNLQPCMTDADLEPDARRATARGRAAHPLPVRVRATTKNRAGPLAKCHGIRETHDRASLATPPRELPAANVCPHGQSPAPAGRLTLSPSPLFSW